MINAKDLPTARAQLEAAVSVMGLSPAANVSHEPPRPEDQSTSRTRPTLALDNGKYYVVDGTK